MLHTTFARTLYPAVEIFAQGSAPPLWAVFDFRGVFRCTVQLESGAGIGIRNVSDDSPTIGVNAVMAAYNLSMNRVVWWDGANLWFENGVYFRYRLIESSVGQLSDGSSPDEAPLPFRVLEIRWSGNDYVAVELLLLGSGDRLIHIYCFDQIPYKLPVLDRTVHDTNGIIVVGGREGQFESAKDPDGSSSPRLLWADPGVANGYFYAKQPDGTHRFKRGSVANWSDGSAAQTVLQLPGSDGRGFTLAAQNLAYKAFAFASTEGHLVCYVNLCRGDWRDWSQFDLRDVLKRELRESFTTAIDPADLRVHDLRWLVGDGELRPRVAISWRQGAVWYAGTLSFFIDNSRLKTLPANKNRRPIDDCFASRDSSSFGLPMFTAQKNHSVLCTCAITSLVFKNIWVYTEYKSFIS